MDSFEEKLLTRAISYLRGINAKYYVITPDGRVFGEKPEDAKPVLPPRKRLHPGITEHIRGYLKDLQPGEVAVVPMGAFPGRAVQSAIASEANRTWGKGSYSTGITADKVHIIREV